MTGLFFILRSFKAISLAAKMAVCFIVTTLLGVVMALKFGRNRRAAFYCLGFGIIFPLILVLIRSAT